MRTLLALGNGRRSEFRAPDALRKVCACDCRIGAGLTGARPTLVRPVVFGQIEACRRQSRAITCGLRITWRRRKPAKFDMNIWVELFTRWPVKPARTTRSR